MSKIYEGFKSPEETSAAWYLKIHNDLIYGPITLPALCDWAAEGGITPGNQVSRDRASWVPADTIP